jgi:nicotinate dehydrogenase subunit A
MAAAILPVPLRWQWNIVVFIEVTAVRISLSVNGKVCIVDAEPDTPLLYILRNDLGLNGPKFGCGLGQCGACVVIMKGKAVRSCIVSVSDIRDREIITLEGLGTSANLSVLQEAFVKEQAAQCGICINGMLMTAKVLLETTANPTDQEIKEALKGNLCRCGSHLRIVRAIKRAAANGAHRSRGA